MQVGAVAEEFGCGGSWERHIKVGREKALKPRVSSLALSMDKRELMDTLKQRNCALGLLILAYD